MGVGPVAAAGSSPAGLALCDAEGRVRAANRAVAELFGREPTALAELTLADLVATADRQAVQDQILHTLAGGERTKSELRYQRLDGAIGWAVLALEPFERAGRRWLLASVLDSTDRRDALDALAHDLGKADGAAEHLAGDGRLRKLLENVTDAVTVLDPAGELAFSVDGLAGFARSDPTDPDAAPIRRVHPDDAERAGRLLARAMAAPGLPL
ncbi:MAG: PAS domain-containing protein, partial [Actinomycetota bacterium]